MNLERSFGQHSPDIPDAHSFLVREPIGTTIESKPFAVPRETVLFSRTDEENGTEALHQETGTNQTDGSVRTSVNDDWEPFNLEPHPSKNFVNLYGGSFSQQMKLNRRNAERLLKVAAIEGKVILADRPMDRSRSIAGVNSDGSVTRRRKLFWGEKIQDEDKSQSLVIPIPEGWRIEIPGQEILEELSKKESKKPLDKRFASRFNQQLRQALSEIIIREKLTEEKYKIIERAINTLLPTGVLTFVSIVGNTPAWYEWLIYQPIGYSILNLLGRVEVLIEQDAQYRRSLQSIYEYFLPEVEIDRVLRGLAFVNLKGRNLVRLKNG